MQLCDRVSSSLLVPVDHSFRALSGRLKLTFRHHELNKDSPLKVARGTGLVGWGRNDLDHLGSSPIRFVGSLRPSVGNTVGITTLFSMQPCEGGTRHGAGGMGKERLGPAGVESWLGDRRVTPSSFFSFFITLQPEVDWYTSL